MKLVLALGTLMLVAQGCQWSIEHVSAGYELSQPAAFDELLHPTAHDPFLRRPAPPISLPAGAVYVDIDWDFLMSLEGRGRTTAYVPTDRRSGRVLGRSGITVASGVDLGQHDTRDLARMGVDRELIVRLEPYLKLRGEGALAFLRRYPLTLSPSEVAGLDGAKYVDTALRVGRRFDRHRAVHVPAFEHLTRAQRTVIVSVALQYGTKLDRRTPAFWNLMSTGRFSDAANELRSFGDGYPTRRAHEAALLQPRQG